MRILVIGPTHPYRGGIATSTTLLVRELRQQHDVLLLSFSRQYPKWLFPGRDDKDPSTAPLRESAEYPLDGINPLTWRRTIHRARRFSPDVVVFPWWVSYWAPAWGTLSRLLKRSGTRPRVIFLCHNATPHDEGGLANRIAQRVALGAGDAFLCHSESDGAELRRLFPRRPVAVTPLPTFAAVGAEGSAELPVQVPEGPLALFFGLVRPYKGLDVLLAAMHRVRQSTPVHLLILGEFWDRGESDAEAIAALGDAVTVVDRWVSDEELAAAVARADIAVLPYRSATQSAVVQMALGHGTPVVTTDVGGLAEAVVDGETGLVVPPGDPDALADAIVRFFGDEMAEPMRRAISQSSQPQWSDYARELEALARR